jgi:hypothetical protein
MLGLAGCLFAAAGVARVAPRHGVVADVESFPQSSPKETLRSVLKAIDLKRLDYLLAHLSDPDWVDHRVSITGGGFPELVKEAADRLDPPTVKELRRFLKDGEVEQLDSSAVLRLKEIKDRVVRFRKIDRSWYLVHSRKP